MNTRLTIQYTDASNYKTHSTVIFAGKLTAEHVETIRANLDEGRFIIAHQLGLPSPLENFVKKYGLDEQDDHVWSHLPDLCEGELDLETLYTEEKPTVRLSVDDLAERIDGIEWNVDAEWARLFEGQSNGLSPSP